MNCDLPILYCLAFLFSLTLTVLCSRMIIPTLKRCAEQPIYTEGPGCHISKAGTPTMGGLSFLIGISVTILLASLYKLLADDIYGALSLIICAVYSVLNAMIGILDDLTKLRHKKNAGLTPRSKLILQFIAAALFIFARSTIIKDGTVISFSFASFDLGVFYYVIASIILVGITNCANLTDGIDGLATTVAFAIGTSYLYCSYGFSETVSLAASALIGGAIGFLIFNINPAKVFMGDTGSLFFGSLIASLAFDLQSPIYSVISGGVYVIEGLSVIAQVLFFKIYKKRLFKMAPIHHHFEKCGWDENKICLCAAVLTVLLGIPAMILCVR